MADACSGPSFHRPSRLLACPQTPQQRQLDPFEAVPLGPAAPGQPDAANPIEFPRPAGPDADAALEAPPPASPRNPHIRFQRLSVNAIPAQQACPRGAVMLLWRWHCADAWHVA